MESLILKIDSIPVILDDIKKYEDFDMSRCSYFTIESDLATESSTPSPNWTLMLQAMNIPFYLIGLSGIIWKPLGEDHIFDSAEMIDDLFDIIESCMELYVDVNDIWLPNYLFHGLPHKRGYVYRITGQLFITAYRYRQEQISRDQFLEFCEEASSDIVFSEVETQAFSEWEKIQIRQAREIYPKKPESKLRHRE
jgi:hypothetical protein